LPLRRLSLAPGSEVDGIQHEAKQVRGNEAPLRRLHSDETDDYAVYAGQDPSFPKPTSDQDR